MYLRRWLEDGKRPGEAWVVSTAVFSTPPPPGRFSVNLCALRKPGILPEVESPPAPHMRPTCAQKPESFILSYTTSARPARPLLPPHSLKFSESTALFTPDGEQLYSRWWWQSCFCGLEISHHRHSDVSSFTFYECVTVTKMSYSKRPPKHLFHS